MTDAKKREAMPGVLEIYTVYARPSDYPGKFVVRKHVASKDGSRPTEWVRVAETLAEAREAIPFGLVCISRDENDDPIIVESWL